jgi:predicted transcriptional regulator
MTSDQVSPAGADHPREAAEPVGLPEVPPEGSPEGSPEERQGGGPGEGRGRLNLTDPKAIRALAHPVRWALLEALGQAGTLTATQASEMLGESPANCAFHLRTLAKYGFVEEAGGGRGRERPWRQSYDGMSWRTRADDPQAAQAAEALDRVWLDRTLTRAQHGLTGMARWPKGLEDALGATTTRMYVTPAEANELYAEISEVFGRVVGSQHRFSDRKDPKLRPADSIPVEFVLMAYPILDLPPLPENAEGDEAVDEAGADG